MIRAFWRSEAFHVSSLTLEHILFFFLFFCHRQKVQKPVESLSDYILLAQRIPQDYLRLGQQLSSESPMHFLESVCIFLGCLFCLAFNLVAQQDVTSFTLPSLSCTQPTGKPLLAALTPAQVPGGPHLWKCRTDDITLHASCLHKGNETTVMTTLKMLTYNQRNNRFTCKNMRQGTSGNIWKPWKACYMTRVEMKPLSSKRWYSSSRISPKCERKWGKNPQARLWWDEGGNRGQLSLKEIVCLKKPGLREGLPEGSCLGNEALIWNVACPPEMTGLKAREPSSSENTQFIKMLPSASASCLHSSLITVTSLSLCG